MTYFTRLVRKHGEGTHDEAAHGNWARGETKDWVGGTRGQVRGQATQEVFEALDDPRDETEVAELIGRYAEPLELAGKTVEGVYLMDDEKGRLYVVEWDGDKYPSVSKADEFLYSSAGDALVKQLGGEIEEQHAKDFWESPPPLYHATDKENVEEIMRHGLRMSSRTRGLTNRWIGSAVFTTQNEDFASSGTYGDTVIEIDTAAMARDRVRPAPALEPAAVEYEARSVLAAALGAGEIGGSYDGADDPDTVVLFGDIPAKYLRVRG